MNQLETTIEQLIDKHGTNEVLQAIVNIADQKEWHIKENWQDKKLAKYWRNVARRISAVLLHPFEY